MTCEWVQLIPLWQSLESVAIPPSVACHQPVACGGALCAGSSSGKLGTLAVSIPDRALPTCLCSSWEALANLDAQNSLAAVNEVTEAMRTAPDDISTVNRLFMAAAGRQPKRPDGPTAALLGIAPVAAPAPAPVQPLPGLAQLSLPQLPGAGLAQAPLQQQPQVQGMLGQQQPFPGPAGPATLFSGQQQQYAPPPGAPGYQQQGPPPLQQQPPPPQQYIGGPDGPVEAGPQPPVQQPLPVQGAMFSGPLGTLPRGVQMHLTRIMNGSGGLVRPEHFDPKLVDMMEVGVVGAGSGSPQAAMAS